MFQVAPNLLFVLWYVYKLHNCVTCLNYHYYLISNNNKYKLKKLSGERQWVGGFLISLPAHYWVDEMYTNMEKNKCHVFCSE